MPNQTKSFLQITKKTKAYKTLTNHPPKNYEICNKIVQKNRFNKDILNMPHCTWYIVMRTPAVGCGQLGRQVSVSALLGPKNTQRIWFSTVIQ